ncbi:hypothetical protein [Vibrio maritimus]|uniref:hypothetical protein n=1 Tax=Vibrio maritimus TaxID=990268 RepID=UPI001F2B27AE|nr:hypothetical protein [Vibrio maritimus]
MKKVQCSWVNNHAFVGLQAEHIDYVQDLRGIKIWSVRESNGARITYFSFLVEPSLYNKFELVDIKAGGSIIGTAEMPAETDKFSMQKTVTIPIVGRLRCQLKCIRGIEIVFYDNEGYKVSRHLRSLNSYCAIARAL